MLSEIVVFLSLVSVSLQAYGLPNHAQICLVACQESFTDVTFGTTNYTDDYYTGYCHDVLRFYSAYLCASHRCSPYEIHSGIAYMQKDCDIVGIELPNYETVIANYSQQTIRTVGYKEITPDQIINSTLLPDDDLFGLSYKTWVGRKSRENYLLTDICGADCLHKNLQCIV